jgi:trimethylamine--corrinoid protein Co-methyltransferase
MPSLMSRKNPDAWIKEGKKELIRLLNGWLLYEKPDIDPEIEKRLKEYVEKRKNS